MTVSYGRAVASAIICTIGAVLIVVSTLPAFTIGIADGKPNSIAFLHISVDNITPDIMTTANEPMVTIKGTITNVGDRPVRDVVVRLEHAGAANSSTTLLPTTDNADIRFEPVDGFIHVSAQLNRGQAKEFRFSYPIRSAAQPSLGVDQPGVYPMLINVNGTPDYGVPARLDEARFVLPVLGLPADPTRRSGGGFTDVITPDTTRPVAVTMLWPLADTPQLAPGVPGGTTPVRLSTDELAGSLSAGGRLDTVLSAAEFATSAQVDPDGAVTQALCLAVDPDLLVTVNAMTSGYIVSDGVSDGLSDTTSGRASNTVADGPGTTSHPGSGQDAAVTWLERLRALASRMCVTSTPYAQADLDALHRVGDRGLAAAATGSGSDIVDQILGVSSLRGATIIGDGVLSAGAVDLLNQQGPTVAITTASTTTANTHTDSAATGSTATTDTRPLRLAPQVVLAPSDRTVNAALGAVGTQIQARTQINTHTPRPADSAVARRQNAVGAVVWQALTPHMSPRTQILLPPLRWNPEPDDAQAVLTTLATIIHSGLALGKPLGDVITEYTDSAEYVLDPGAHHRNVFSAPSSFDDGVVSTIAGQIGRLWGLTSALGTNAQTGLTGMQYTAPLREDMLRALSQIPPPLTRNKLAQQRLRIVGRTIDDLFGAVGIVNPGGAYTLATEHSPLPLALRNDLAVPIRVHIDVEAPPGMEVTDIGVQELPPGYLPLRVPIEVHFTQRVAVDVTLRTTDGLQLGEPVRLSVHSNAYGKVLFTITLTGAAILVVLVGRRLYHRFRGQPDRADFDQPDGNTVAEKDL